SGSRIFPVRLHEVRRYRILTIVHLLDIRDVPATHLVDVPLVAAHRPLAGDLLDLDNPGLKPGLERGHRPRALARYDALPKSQYVVRRHKAECQGRQTKNDNDYEGLARNGRPDQTHETSEHAESHGRTDKPARQPHDPASPLPSHQRESS